jgi:outer membrane protein assembly factor BamD (BamD/ComL family)
MVGSFGWEASGGRDRWRLGAGILLCLLLLAGAACSNGAAELWDSATLEEQQRNPAHAADLYRELIERYPDSPEAARARERLRALGHTAR